MKKISKKQKFLDFWNKIKKPLMILSFIGNIFFLLFIIVGCVGVKKSTQAKAEDTTPPVYTLRGTNWNMNDIISRSPNGQILYDYGTITQETYLLSYTYDNKNFMNLVFKSIDNEAVFGGDYVYNEYGGLRWFTIYRGSHDVWSTDSQFIEIPSNQANHTDAENNVLLSWFQLNGSIERVNDFTFTFNKSINYNAPYNSTTESQFISHHFEESGTLGFELVYDFPVFYSNGEYFNRIRLWYQNGFQIRYKDTDGSIKKNGNTETAYFGFMQYINTSTNRVVDVNTRNNVIGHVDDSNGTLGYIDFGSTWKNNEFQTLYFQYELSPQERTNLSQFNNFSLVDGFAGIGDDVGVQNVFSIVSSCFESLTSLWSIKILPNITLGLLLFLPLIGTIIIVIIKLVKR